MLARIAHELFWLGRSVRRAEHTARMLDGVFQLDLQGRPDAPSTVTLSWQALLAILGADAVDGSVTRNGAITRLTLDRTHASSVSSCVSRAREGARTVRDVISSEMWEAINAFHLGHDDASQKLADNAGPYAYVSYVKTSCALFWGVAARTMLRDEAYAFLEAGGRFESANMVLRMLRVALPPNDDWQTIPTERLLDGQALALLQAVGGLQAYRRAIPAPPHAEPVASFLLFTLSYPDSVAASVDAVRNALTSADVNPRSSAPVLRLSRMLADLEFRGRRVTHDRDLSKVCETVDRELALADRDIAERYFAGASPLHFNA